jgi:hypothetical protein
MNKSLIVAAIVLAFSNSACAKLRVSISVETSNEKIKRELQEDLEARINSTDRYTIARNAIETELWLEVYCLALERGPVVCRSDVTYYPYKNSPVSLHIETAENMASSVPDDITYITNALMNHFINGTTDANLEDGKNLFRKGIQLLYATVPAECKMPHQ